jgi:hypothetical protein
MRSAPATLKTATIIQSYTAATADGRVAVVLGTKEVGIFAFELNAEAIAKIRRELAEAERFLSREWLPERSQRNDGLPARIANFGHPRISKNTHENDISVIGSFGISTKPPPSNTAGRDGVGRH